MPEPTPAKDIKLQWKSSVNATPQSTRLSACCHLSSWKTPPLNPIPIPLHKHQKGDTMYFACPPGAALRTATLPSEATKLVMTTAATSSQMREHQDRTQSLAVCAGMSSRVVRVVTKNMANRMVQRLARSLNRLEMTRRLSSLPSKAATCSSLKIQSTNRTTKRCGSPFESYYAVISRPHRQHKPVPIQPRQPLFPLSLLRNFSPVEQFRNIVL